MRKSRLDPDARSADGKTTLLVPPWPRWAYIETPESTMHLYWSKGVIEDLFPLAQGFSMTVYNLRTELAPRTLPCLSRAVNVYLRFLVTVPEWERPSVIDEINEDHLRAFQAEMEKSPQDRIFPSRVNLESGARLVSQLKGLVADAWRLGVAHGAIRPNLGRHGFRNIPVSPRWTRRKKIYSEREFRLILRFLLSRRDVARGGTVKEERAYLSTCVCVLHIYLPMNLSSAFLLNEGSLRQTESDQKYDVLSVLKKRPKDSVNVLPEPKPEEFESEDLLVVRGVSQVRKIFEENMVFNASNPGRSDESALFQVLYPKSRLEHRPVHGRFNQPAYAAGMATLNEEFNEIGDDGDPLLISAKKLRATFENRLPDSMSMRRKADLMHHKSEETTGSDYEAVTDVEHLRFYRGLKAIGVSIRGDEGEALAWVRETGLLIFTQS